jgi:two-component system sensor histidine kinase KdpD
MMRTAAVGHDESPPKPELFLDLIRRQQRGRLKIYLGFAAGVGKTFDMLQEGNRLRRQGIDVAIGFVETHGRVETIAQIGELEQVPRRRIEYHGIVLEEMDIDAVLARRPTITLVDELAHTNAPGSRNPKRYQDVEELIRAGISVITTLNIQHLESLHDIVERATGVRVKERIPDYVVTMADQIVNVDLSAEDLRERLQAGKIYPAERVQTAMENFFAPDKLTQLRELAMEEIAYRLDRHRREDEQRRGETSSGSERVMVCLSSRSPRADALLRKASRIADRMGAPWYAVYVRTPREALEQIDAATQRQVDNNLDLARQLGGTSLPFQGADVVSTIASFVKEYGITHIIVGRSRQPWYRRWFGRSILDRLLQTVPGIDVIVVDNSASYAD